MEEVRQMQTRGLLMTGITAVMGVLSLLFWAWIALRVVTILERLPLSAAEALEAYADAKRKG